jgi:hypothetical protein
MHIGFQYAFLIPSILTFGVCSILFMLFDRKHFQRGSKFEEIEQVPNRELKRSLFHTEAELDTKNIVYDKQVSIWRIIAKLFRNGKYITLVLTVINLYFILYGVQTWTT